MSSTAKKATVKKVSTRSLKLISSEQKKDLGKKSKINVSESALTDYLKKANNGEKKLEASIKYWFEKNIDGHTSEETFDSGRPDGYTPGWLLLELKGEQNDWLEGFFEGLARKELSFKLLVVAAHNTLLVFPGRSYIPKDWKNNKLTEWQNLLKEVDKCTGPASTIAKKLAKDFKNKRSRFLEYAIFEWFIREEGGLEVNQTESEAVESFKALVTSYDPSNARIEITPRNFGKILKNLLPYFNPTLSKQFESVHGFFRCLTYLNESYQPIIPDNPEDEDKVFVGGGYFEGLITDERENFVKVLTHYEVKNPNKSAFYAKYDKAIDAVDPDYRTNNGIYFTSEYLARLAITMTERHVGSIANNYIVFDPACGSGNLVTSWNHHLDLKHKVVSEISPLLLKAFELRFHNSSTEKKKGFTIIPKTSSGDGLNFVDQAADKYLEKIHTELESNGHKLNNGICQDRCRLSFYAAFIFSTFFLALPGFNSTTSTTDQFLVLLDHLRGFFNFASV